MANPIPPRSDRGVGPPPGPAGRQTTNKQRPTHLANDRRRWSRHPIKEAIIVRTNEADKFKKQGKTVLAEKREDTLAVLTQQLGVYQDILEEIKEAKQRVPRYTDA